MPRSSANAGRDAIDRTGNPVRNHSKALGKITYTVGRKINGYSCLKKGIVSLSFLRAGPAACGCFDLRCFLKSRICWTVSIQKWTGTNSALANLVEIKARGNFNRRHKGIRLIFRGLNFSRNTDIGQIGHLWMDNR